MQEWEMEVEILIAVRIVRAIKIAQPADVRKLAVVQIRKKRKRHLLIRKSFSVVNYCILFSF